MTSNTPSDSALLIIDLASGQSVVRDVGILDGATERHRIDLLLGLNLHHSDDRTKLLDAFTGNAVAFVVNSGLPNKHVLMAAHRLLAKGRKAYFYWPNEQAVEIADRHRIASYWNHVWAYRLLRLPTTLRNGASGVKSKIVASPIGSVAVAAKRSVIRIRNLRVAALTPVIDKTPRDSVTVAAVAPPNEPGRIHFEVAQRLAGREQRNAQIGRVISSTQEQKLASASLFGQGQLTENSLPSAVRPLEGRGVYVRLDYWAKLKTGGSYGHTCFLAKSSAAMCRDFVCLFANRFELLDRLGVKQRVLNHQFASSTSAQLIENGEKFIPMLRRQFDELKPSFVYERSVLGNCAAAVLCEERKIPYIVEYNGSELSMARSFGRPYELDAILESIEDYAFDVATVINVISEPVAESLIERGVAREKILVNPNAVDLDFYKPADDADRSKIRSELDLPLDAVVIGFCGTFGGWHGIEVLAKGMVKICEKEPKAHFLLIGDGNLKPLIKKAIVDGNIQSNVTDLGLIPQMDGARAMSVCDILVATHAQNIDNRTFFGSPTKLFEYMAIGAGIVSSDLAQLGEVMRPALTTADLAAGRLEITNQRGVLIKPGDVDDFVAAVLGLIVHDGVRKKLGQNALNAARENYTWDNHVANIWRHMAGLPLKGYVSDKDLVH